MTNKELILQLLDTDLNAECDLRKTVGNVTFKPMTTSKWIRDGQHAVVCEKCGCRVSVNAYPSMRFCFICGAEMVG